MQFSQIQKDIINYIRDYLKGVVSLRPCFEVLQKVLKEKYSKLEIEDCVLDLISSGILTSYSFHAYLGLTETFKTRVDNNINNKLK